MLGVMRVLPRTLIFSSSSKVSAPYGETVRLRGALRSFPRAVDIIVIDEAEAAEPASLAIAVALREGRVVYEHTGTAAVRPNAA